MKDTEIKYKIGSVFEYEFIENSFHRSNIDNTFRRVALQISGFKELPKSRVEDQFGNNMDFEVFLLTLTVINGSNEAIFSKNNDIIVEVGGEIQFRLIPTTETHLNYIRPDGTIILELDLATPTKASTVDGYTGMSDINFDADTFTISYTVHEAKQETSDNVVKFKEKNEDTLKELNDYIDNNRKSIKALVVAPEMIHNLCDFHPNDKQMIGYKYREVRIIVDFYSPVKAIRILHEVAARFDFNVPCVCGVYPDEEHNRELN